MPATPRYPEVTRAWYVALVVTILSLLAIPGGGFVAAMVTGALVLLSIWIYQGSRIPLVILLLLLGWIAVGELGAYFRGAGTVSLVTTLLFGAGAAVMGQAFARLQRDLTATTPPGPEPGVEVAPPDAVTADPPATEPATPPVQAAPDHGPPFTYPYIYRRYQALLIDGLFLLTIILVVPLFLQHLPAGRIALLVALVSYEAALTAFACTLGQRIIGIRVRRADDPSRRISLPAAYVRWAVKLVLGIISFFTMRAANRYRALHDLASGSIMINAPMAVSRPP